jgi:hypothetical protein
MIGAKAVSLSCGDFFSQAIPRNWNPAIGDYEDPTDSAADGMCNSFCPSNGHDTYSGNFTFSPNGGGSFAWKTIQVNCDCCNYVTSPTPSCTETVTSIDSDSATITNCNVGGEYESNTGEFTGNPTNASIRNKVCDNEGYTNLDSVVSINTSGLVVDLFRVVAVCSGNTAAPNNNDACRGALLGNEASASSAGVPYICENDQCWRDVCATITPPADMCKACDTEGSFYWIDTDITGDTCNADVPNIISGNIRNVPFFNTTYNGQASFHCNNGIKTLSASDCYINCKDGGVSWGDGLLSYYFNQDKAGRCNENMVDKGNYRHDELTQQLNSLGNTGQAVLRCDGSDGAWDIEGTIDASCNDGKFTYSPDAYNMDCPATVPAQSWSGGGRTCTIAAKNVGISRHTTITSAFRNEVGINIGSVNMRCNDGIWDINSSSCAPKPCNAVAKSWTGTYDSCSQSIPAGTEGQTRTIFNTTFTTGNATYKCTDTNSASNKAEWVLQSVGACYKGCSNTTKTWTNSQTCSDSVGINGEHGVTRGLSDTTFASSGGGTGSATARCNGTTGNWDLSGTSCILSKNCAGSWGAGWSDCNPLLACNGVDNAASCNESRTFTRTRNGSGIGDNSCTSNGQVENRLDTTNSCAVTCNQFYSLYGAYGACNSTCGGGTKTRTRTWNNTGVNLCTAGTLTSSTSCNTQNCPRNCVGSWSGWSGYSSCSGGTKTRTRTFNVTTTAADGGSACTFADGAIDTETSSSGCSVDCVGSWSSCSSNISTYTITQSKVGGGASCPSSNGSTKVCGWDCDPLLGYGGQYGMEGDRYGNEEGPWVVCGSNGADWVVRKCTLSWSGNFYWDEVGRGCP